MGARLTGAVAALAVTTVLGPALAGANTTNWLVNGSLAPGVAGRQGDATRTALNSSLAVAESGSKKIDAGAHLPGGLTLYGSWVEAFGTACHNYSGENVGAMIENPHSVTQSPVSATSGWTGGSGSNYC